MTEEEARAWLAERWSPASIVKLEAYVGMLREANESQNLISRSSADAVWARHIVDSAQLLTFSDAGNNWLDIGSGAGLPGIVIAILDPKPITLVEPRRKRSEFLEAAVSRLGLPFARVIACDVARLPTEAYDRITARAFAPLDKIFSSTWRFGVPNGRWLLPKGKSARFELEQAERNWQGLFHVKQSITDIQSGIVIASQLSPRGAT